MLGSHLCGEYIITGNVRIISLLMKPTRNSGLIFVSPQNHISVSDSRAVTDIYGHGANFLKDAWYDGGAGEHRHLADARVKAEHQRKRKMMAHVFAQKTIPNLEPIITETTGTLVAQVDKHAASGRPINMCRYLNYYTIDLFAELLYSSTLGCLQRGNDMVYAETQDGKIYQAPFIKSLHDATIINTILGMESGILPLTKKLFSRHPYKKTGADYDNIIFHNTKKRLQDPDAGNDIFSKLLTSSVPIYSPSAVLANKSICWPTNQIWSIQQDAHQRCNF
jgi:cytochrome P450